MLILIVAGGPDKGRLYELSDDREALLGRDGADVALNDSKISRRHARMWSDGGRWYIQDLDSKHGTHRNHKEVHDHQPLKDGDYLQIGRTVLVVARVPAERAAALALSHQSSQGMSNKTRYAIAGLSAAAVVLIGLNVVSLWQSTEGVDRIETRLAQSDAAAESTESAIQRDLQLAMKTKAEHEQRVERMIIAFQPNNNQLLPKLDSILAAVESQPDVVGPLTELAEAVKDRSGEEATEQKIDTALALLRERGGDAEALADQFREMLAERPTLDQIAAATRQDNDEATVELMGRVLAKLDSQAAMGVELAQLRKLIQEKPTDATGDDLRPMLAQVLASLETFDPASGNQPVLAAIADVKSALPTDPSAKLDSLLARFETQPTGQQVAQVNQRLAALATQLSDRSDTQLIQQQLTQLTKAQDARQAAIAADDPLLGQILARVDALAANDRKLDAIYAELKDQPYRNRAMLGEAFAQLGVEAEQATDPADHRLVAAMLDQAMAELRGKSITDADELRRMIRREMATVATARRSADDPQVTVANSTAARRLTKTETAYKLAFETGRKITLGTGVIDPTTGQSSKGRTLDPALAKADGVKSWRDWYLLDDFAQRAQLYDHATRLADREGSAVLTLPEDDSTTINASPVPR